jgi:hypothetical protein
MTRSIEGTKRPKHDDEITKLFDSILITVISFFFLPCSIRFSTSVPFFYDKRPKHEEKMTKLLLKIIGSNKFFVLIKF